MPLYSCEALILRTYKLGEADRIVVFLTRDRGKKRGVAKGARRPRSRFVGGLEPLTHARVAYFERENRELVGLNYSEAERSPLSAVDPKALTHATYFAELLDEWAQEADPDERLYRLGAAMVDALAEGVPVDPLARYFEYWLLRLQGIYPDLGACAACGQRLDRPAGGADRVVGVLAGERRSFVCPSCTSQPGGIRLSRESLAFLRAAAGLDPRRLGEHAVSSRVVRELETLHRMLITGYLEKELKSVRVLKDMG